MGGSGANKEARQELPPSDGEKTAKELEKILDNDPKAVDSLLREAAKSDVPETPNKSSNKSVKAEDKSRSTEDHSIHKVDGNAEHSLRSTVPEKIEAPKQVAQIGSIRRTVKAPAPEMHQITSHAP